MRVRDIWVRLDRHPPILLRLMARKPRSRPLETTEIAERSGLSVMQVEAISVQTDWRGIDLPTARAFMVGCDCDLGDRRTYRRMRMSLRYRPKTAPRFPYLRRSPKWESYYLPLLDRFTAHLKGHARTTTIRSSQTS